MAAVYISITKFSCRFRFGEVTLYSQTLIFAWMCWKGSWVYPLLLFQDISMYVWSKIMFFWKIFLMYVQFFSYKNQINLFFFIGASHQCTMVMIQITLHTHFFTSNSNFQNIIISLGLDYMPSQSWLPSTLLSAYCDSQTRPEKQVQVKKALKRLTKVEVKEYDTENSCHKTMPLLLDMFNHWLTRLFPT